MKGARSKPAILVMAENGKKRSIDERLDALTQSVELLSSMHQDNEKRMAELIKVHADYEKWLVLLTKLVSKHESRLDDLDGGEQENGGGQ
jgi:hypothetical protein